jgi:hypothetical protein
MMPTWLMVLLTIAGAWQGGVWLGYLTAWLYHKCREHQADRYWINKMREDDDDEYGGVI